MKITWENYRIINGSKKRGFRPKSQIGQYGHSGGSRAARRRERPLAWAVWDDPGLSGTPDSYLKVVICTVVGL
jgi:hypothetical protein